MKHLLLLILFTTNLYADTLSNTFKMGNGGASNKQIIMNRGGSNPQVRWNESAGKLQGTTDGSNFFNIQSPNQSTIVENLGLAYSVGSSALTIALKQSDGATNASTDIPVRVAMRSATITSSAYNTRSATGAVSLVISSGSTLGCVTGSVNCWVFVYVIDNSGTLELAASRALVNDGTLITTVAEGGAGAADSATVVYSTTARSSVPIRLIGRGLFTLATAGTWNETPDRAEVNPVIVRQLYSVYVTKSGGTPATVLEYPAWVGSYTNVGTGKVTVNVPAGFFAQAPICSATAVNGTGQRSCELTLSPSATAIDVVCSDGGSPADEAFTLNCVGVQ